MATLPSLRQLRYLIELADRLNFRAAAEACFVTQSTLSAGLKELESTLGVQLVERNTRNVRLTPAGAEIVRRARALVAEAEDLVEAARAVQEPLSGLLRLGVIPTIAPFVLPRVLPVLRKRHPKLRLRLREDLTERLLERLRAGALDMALIALPYDTGELEVRKLFEDPLRLVAPPDDPLVQRSRVPVEALGEREVVLLEEGHCLREHALEACGRRDTGNETGVEATSLPTLLQIVAGGFGVTLLPEIALEAGILKGTGLVARPFARSVPSRTLALVARPTSRLAELDLLAEILRRHAAPARNGSAGGKA